MALAMTLIVHSRRARAIVAATLAMLEDRISRDDMERRNREGEQLELGVGAAMPERPEGKRVGNVG